jgi:hypothetical protein
LLQALVVTVVQALIQANKPGSVIIPELLGSYSQLKCVAFKAGNYLSSPAAVYRRDVQGYMSPLSRQRGRQYFKRSH